VTEQTAVAVSPERSAPSDVATIEQPDAR